jgi:F0F1-type ATP synthase membrane subunit b/b'
MQILTSLGVDSTLVIHLICFLVSYVAFTTLVLKPYMKALNERENRTVGNEETAVRLLDETTTMQAQYESKARAINGQIKGHFDESRAEAMKQHDELVKSAREQAAVLLEQSRAEIEQQIQQAKKSLSAEIPVIGSAIASKLAGKEISL